MRTFCGTLFNFLKKSSFFNGKKAFCFLGILMLFGFADISAMSFVNIEKNTKRCFDVKMPLSQWPVINSLRTRRELDCYRIMWDATKTLEENKKELVKQFIETCCDFSFRKKTGELPGITVGGIDNDEDIVFPKKGVGIYARPNSEEVLIYNEKDRSLGLRAHITTNIFLDITPLDFTQDMKNELKRSIAELAEDSVGCEILRIATSRYKGSTRELPKITFIPIKNKGIGLAYTTNCNVWNYIKKNKEIHRNKYRKLCKERKFIMFSPNWFESCKPALFIKMKDFSSNGRDADFSLISGIIPKEVNLIHQIIYALNARKNNEYRETRLIEDRTVPKYFHTNFKETGDCLISVRQINHSLFMDDKIYRTMYGLTNEGLDLVNESAYLAHRYKLIRPTYLGSGTQLSINGNALSRSESYRFLDTFLKTNGDQDLFRYYLSPKSMIDYPEFGIGRYSCSNIKVAAKNNKT